MRPERMMQRRNVSERNLWNVDQGPISLRARRELHHLGPLLGFICDEFTEVGGRARKRREAQFRKPRRYLGVGERGIDLLVELVDDLDGVFLGTPTPSHTLAS
jgi:hypothetical protein